MSQEAETPAASARPRKSRFQIGSEDLLATLAALGVAPAERLTAVSARLVPGSDLPAALIEAGLASAHSLAAIGLEQFERQSFSTEFVLVDPAAAALADFTALARRRFLPLCAADKTVHVAVAELLDIRRIEEIRAALPAGTSLHPELWPAAELRDAIEMALDRKFRMDRILAEISQISIAAAEVGLPGGAPRRPAPLRPAFELRKRASEASILAEGPRRLWAEAGVRLLNGLIVRAVTEGASGIWFDPRKGGFLTRRRRDGQLEKGMTLSQDQMAALDEGLRIEPGTNAQLQFRLGAARLVLDVSRAGADGVTQHIALRKLKQPVPPLSQLNLSERAARSAKRAVARPRGLTVIASPPGQGRSGLMASLARLALPAGRYGAYLAPRPEFDIPGFTYYPVTDEQALGETLARLVRDEADLIIADDMVTGAGWQALVDAGLSGARVLATLTAGDAPAALGRLSAMGIGPAVLSLGLCGVLAQSLVPGLCTACRHPHPMSAGEARLLGFTEPEAAPALYRAEGCEACGHRGSAGRLPLLEAMLIDRAAAEAMAAGGSATQLLAASKAKWGTLTQVEDGFARVKAGEIDLDKLARLIDVAGG